LYISSSHSGSSNLSKFIVKLPQLIANAPLSEIVFPSLVIDSKLVALALNQGTVIFQVSESTVEPAGNAFLSTSDINFCSSTTSHLTTDDLKSLTSYLTVLETLSSESYEGFL